ncbi:9570_t:CDS:2 [Ambispora gerdemannii]|uniref:9570_t:CDS:1 n=1 Tax=Ambispora gerdemannii TaxID=144530 RepID=A0A9N9EMP3_9GLOM|nr:9570_t:CDS:2 [Ambispora gerdemannii]
MPSIKGDAEAQSTRSISTSLDNNEVQERKSVSYTSLNENDDYDVEMSELRKDAYDYSDSDHDTIVDEQEQKEQQDGKEEIKPPRKNPHPIRSPSKEDFSNSSINFTCQVYNIYMQNPRLLLDSKTVRSHPRPKHENSVIGSIDKTKPPPPLQKSVSQLLHEIESLEYNQEPLDHVKRPKITWKGMPHDIRNESYFEVLHHVEAQVVSTLRMTPIQYLNTKLAILSAAREFEDRGLPFRKVDAQRAVRIDVNKACKLWEFFHDVGWF